MEKRAGSDEAVQDSAIGLANPPVAKPRRGEARPVPLATREMPPELAEYMAQFYDVFPRLETFENACSYVLGLLSELPRKNGEKMTEAIEGIANTEAVHRLMALSPWSAEKLDELRVAHALRLATSRAGEPALILDEVGQLKQGKASVGVKRQYLGSEGKTANGQVTVTAHYCDGHFDWPVTGRLYLPKDWAEDQDRREKAGVPEDIAFATKAEIALDLVRRAVAWGVPVRWVIMDAGYDDLDVLVELERLELAFCIGVKRDFMVRVPEEIERWIPPPPARRGRPRKHVDPRSLPPVYRADEVLAALPESIWRAITYRQGTAGPLTKEFAAFGVQCATTKRIGPAVWLLFERPLPGDRGEVKAYVVSARRQITLDELAQVAHRRPLIERFSYENGKGEVGLRDYQGRSWRGFHHHLALAMLALTWLNLQRQLLPEQPPGAEPPAAPAAPPPPPKLLLPFGERPLHFAVAQPSAVALPLPRQIWESVQEVCRRLHDWCSITVHHALTRRGTSLPRPAFVRLC
jgi:SRSO17 transposase